MVFIYKESLFGKITKTFYVDSVNRWLIIYIASKTLQNKNENVNNLNNFI